MKLLGIDHGTKSGYGFIDTKKNIVHAGRFRVAGETDGEKFNTFQQNIENLIETYKPDVICSERPMDKLNGRTTTYLIGLYSIIHLCAYKHNIEIVEMFPTSVKKTITGSGKADKIDVARALSYAYNIPLESIAIPIRYKRTAYNRKLRRIVNKGEIRDYELDPSDALALCEVYRLTNQKKIKEIDNETTDM